MLKKLFNKMKKIKMKKIKMKKIKIKKIKIKKKSFWIKIDLINYKEKNEAFYSIIFQLFI